MLNLITINDKDDYINISFWKHHHFSGNLCYDYVRDRTIQYSKRDPKSRYYTNYHSSYIDVWYNTLTIGHMFSIKNMKIVHLTGMLNINIL